MKELELHAGMGTFPSARGTAAWDTPNSKESTRKDAALAAR